MINTCDMFPSTPIERMQESIAKIERLVSQSSHKRDYETISERKNQYQHYLDTCVRHKYPFFDAVKAIGTERGVDWGVALEMYRFENDVKIDEETCRSFFRDVNPLYY